MSHVSRYFQRLFVATAFLLWCRPLLAIESNNPPPSSPSSLPNPDPGSELLLFTDIPVVISASRQAAPINQTAAATSIVTADDIHYSGLTNLNDVLRFTPGVDVLSIDRNRVAIGIHGMHSVLSNRTLTLLNGRDAGSLVDEAPQLELLPLFLEDVQRIEVVRGPSGGAWGANAVNGVINIITKEPKDTLGVLASSTVNEYGDTYSQVRWGAEDGPWSWRVSGGYENNASSADANVGDSITSHDWARNWRFDGEAVYDANTNSKLTLGAAAAHFAQGSLTSHDLPITPDNSVDTLRLFTRLDHNFADKSSLYVQWYGNYENAAPLINFQQWAIKNDWEAQYSFYPNPEHHVTVGGNVRWLHIDAFPDAPRETMYSNDPYDDTWLGLFAVDRWQLDPHLALEGQFRGDYYSQQGLDWSGRVAALWSLDNQHHHVLRMAGAKSFREPTHPMTDGTLGIIALPVPPYYLATLSGDPEAHNEEVWSAELGYSGQLTHWLTVHADAYRQWYYHLLGAETVSVAPLAVAYNDNVNTTGWGVELGADVHVEQVMLSAWYAYNMVDDGFIPGGQNIRGLLPPHHSVGVTARWQPTDLWTASANFRYTSLTPTDSPTSSSSVEPSYRLDLVLARALPDWHSEVMIGVQDVLDQGTNPCGDDANFGSPPAPGRTLFLRWQAKF